MTPRAWGALPGRSELAWESAGLHGKRAEFLMQACACEN